MESNEVRLRGTVKRDAVAAEGRGNKVLDFALEVWNESSKRKDVFDCRMTSLSDAMDELEGFVSEGEELEVVGHLEKMTNTERQRVAGVWMEVRHTGVVVYVDEIIYTEE